MCNARSGARGTQTWNNLSPGWLTRNDWKNAEIEQQQKLWSDLGAILQRCLLYWGPFKVGGETQQENHSFDDLVFSRSSAKEQSELISISIISIICLIILLMCDQTALSREACDAQNIYCAGCCRGDPLTHSSSPSLLTSWFLPIFIIMTSQDVTSWSGCRRERVDGGRRRQLGRQPGVQLGDLQQVRVNQVGVEVGNWKIWKISTIMTLSASERSSHGAAGHQLGPKETLAGFWNQMPTTWANWLAFNYTSEPHKRTITLTSWLLLWWTLKLLVKISDFRLVVSDDIVFAIGD